MSHDRRIILGVSGGIAAYKAAILVSRLVQDGRQVSVVMTPQASHFIGPATFAALTGAYPVTDVFDPRFPLGAHIELAKDAQLFVVAPATARVIASCALGRSDDLISTLYLNVECPVLMAPAMSAPMWDKPAVQRNISLLREDGVHLVGPESGWLSCRRTGMGRMSEPESILKACQSYFK